MGKRLEKIWKKKLWIRKGEKIDKNNNKIVLIAINDRNRIE